MDTLYRWQQTTCSIWLTFFFFFYGNLANRRNLTELISIVRDRQWSVAKNDDVAQVVAMTAYISGYEIWETDMDDSYD